MIRAPLLFAFIGLACVGARAACAAPTAPAPLPARAPAVIGGELIQAFNHRDEPALTDLIDMNAFGLRAAKSMYDDPGQQAAFARGLAHAGAHNILQSYFKSLDATQGTMKLLREVERDRQRLVLTRIDLKTKGFDWLEFVIEPDNAGRPRVVDWFQLSRGELLSVTVGALGRLLFDPNPDLIHTLLGVPKVDAEVVEQMKQIGALQRAGDYSGELVALSKLPQPIAESRRLLMVRAATASIAGQDAVYRSTLDVVAQRYGNDPAAAFMLLDHYILENQTANALHSIAVIEQRVGADGATSLLKANVYLLSGAFAPGIACAQESIRLEPQLSSGYFSLARGYVGLQDYPQAISVYRTLSSQFGYRFERRGFAAEPKYAAFVQSDAFAKWLPP